MTVGIVVVSHSPALAQAAVDLALEMTPAGGPPVAVAAGGPGGVTGTDAVAVSEAIGQVASPDGVLVLMDLGSAVLSAEMALEFVDDPDLPVRLTSAPFVEGLLAAVVSAAGGASLEAVEREAKGALAAKAGHLADDEPAAAPAAAADAGRAAAVTRDLTLINPVGMHARPAALLVSALGGLDAAVTVQNLRTGRPPVAVSGTTALLTIDGRNGDTLRFGASGPDADEALHRVADLVGRGFDELGTPAPTGAAVGFVPPGALATTPPPAGPATSPVVGGETRAAGGEVHPQPPAGSPAAGSSAVSGAAPAPAAGHGGAPLGVSPGRGVGPVVHMPPPVTEPSSGSTVPEDARAAEAERVDASASAVAAELRDRAGRVEADAKAILEANALIAEDQGVLADARARVTGQGLAAAPAVWQAFTAVAEMFAAAGGVIAGRVADVQDVRNRIVAHLQGLPAPGVPVRTEPFVLVARDLAPADTALLDPAVCRALVTSEGGPTSHAAILARSLGLPAVVGAPAALDIPEGTLLLVDGGTGELIVDPSPELVAQVKAAPKAPAFDGHGTLADGTAVKLKANVGGAADAERGVKANAQGVGLFRTEFLFLDRPTPPTPDEQVAAYRAVLEKFPHDDVVIRTLDAGADKPLAFVGPQHEENPALGVRGLRTSWQWPDVLTGQLDAIAAAATATGTRPWVMAPMVSTVAEAAGFVALAKEHGIATAGVMVETPSAALLADELLRVVDFVSLGTNDLAQYTMAADRLSGELAALNDPWQPAVLRLIAQVGAAGRRTGTPVGVCGEAAGDPLLAVVLVGAGVTSLSMAPGLLGPVAAQLAAVDAAGAQKAAAAALAATDPAGAKAAVRAVLGG